MKKQKTVKHSNITKVKAKAKAKTVKKAVRVLLDGKLIQAYILNTNCKSKAVDKKGKSLIKYCVEPVKAEKNKPKYRFIMPSQVR